MKNTDYIYKDDLDKACFEHDMAYSKFNNLDKRTQSENILTDKAFEIASNPKHVDYQRRLAPMVFMFLTKNLLEVVLKMKLKKTNNLQMNFMTQLIENVKDK